MLIHSIVNNLNLVLDLNLDHEIQELCMNTILNSKLDGH